MRIILIILCSLAFLLCGCNNTEVPTDAPTAVTEMTLSPTPSIPDPLTVSELAAEDFLLPFDRFSWEREFPPEYVMLHFTSAVMLSRDEPYDIDAVRGIFVDSEVSIHYIIDREGVVRCYIPENRAAWHAGKGEFGGVEKLTDAMNKYSIGIEIIAMGSERDMSVYMTSEEYRQLDPKLLGFTEAQYDALIPLVKDICQRNGIPYDRDHVIGHSEYKKEKTDPGELFDWDRLF